MAGIHGEGIVAKRSRILVVILNWNGGSDLLNCMSSLSPATDDPLTPADHEILLVDNASYDGSFEQACARFPKVHVLRNGNNDYWTGGNNRAIHWALARGYDWLVFCNNDIVVDRRWSQALPRISQDPSIAVVGFNVIGEYQRTTRQLFDEACESFCAEQLAWQDDTYISGCFLAVRSTCFTTLGLFDPAYCMYADDDDFLIRVRLAGWRTVRCNAPIWHVSELASRQVPLLTSYLAIRNTLRLRLKFGPHRLRRACGFVLEVLLRMLNPRQPVDLVNSHLRRLKPCGNPLINLGILAAACGWNLLQLPATLRLGRAQRRQALAAADRRTGRRS